MTLTCSSHLLPLALRAPADTGCCSPRESHGARGARATALLCPTLSVLTPRVWGSTTLLRAGQRASGQASGSWASHWPGTCTGDPGSRCLSPSHNVSHSTPISLHKPHTPPPHYPINTTPTPSLKSHYNPHLHHTHTPHAPT